MQGATLADAPAQARRLIRRRQQGSDVMVLDQVQYGCLVSRVAPLHPNGGAWTVSRALGEALPVLEAVEAKKKARSGTDFGELVRERRRQRGLPLPIADKVLPFRANSHDENLGSGSAGSVGDQKNLIGPLPPRVALAEARVAEAWMRLAEAERCRVGPRKLHSLEKDYVREMQVFAATYAEVGIEAVPRA